MKISLRNPDLLHIETQSGASIGGSQEWYADNWQRMSGCAPTAAANQIWYLSRSRAELSCLCGTGYTDQERYINLQSKLFTYITPSRFGGTNTSEIFTSGAVKYGEANGIQFQPQVMEVPRICSKRASRESVHSFFEAAFQVDCPIAFLNLSNGNQNKLDSWHWVTIICFDMDTMVAEVCDQGYIIEVNFSEWLQTSLLGGALVYFEVSEAMKC